MHSITNKQAAKEEININAGKSNKIAVYWYTEILHCPPPKKKEGEPC
jgi:hypothetical protein